MSYNYTSWYSFLAQSQRAFGGVNTGKSIYQYFVKLPHAQGRIIQTSVWMVSGIPASIVFREGMWKTKFEDASPFLLHVIPKSEIKTFNF